MLLPSQLRLTITANHRYFVSLDSTRGALWQNDVWHDNAYEAVISK